MSFVTIRALAPIAAVNGRVKPGDVLWPDRLEPQIDASEHHLRGR